MAAEEKPVTKIHAINTSNRYEVVHMLRRLADKIESGEYGKVANVVAIVADQGGPTGSKLHMLHGGMGDLAAVNLLLDRGKRKLLAIAEGE